MIKIGIDLDNTIINYNKLIFKLSQKKYNLKFKEKNISKDKIKKKIIKNFGENEWTFFQSLIYGEHLKSAEIYDNFKDIIKKFRNKYEFYIVSHKTKWPAIGKKINLINFAKNFLSINKVSFCSNPLINPKNIFFENTQNKKVKRIKSLKIDLFIDDLEIVLKKNKLKNNILFGQKNKNFLSFDNWRNFEITLFECLFSKIKKDLEKKIGKIINIKFINLGFNNTCIKINSFKGKFFLKIYENSKIRHPLIRELSFYRSIDKLELSPKIIKVNKRENYILFDYIEGKKIIFPTNSDIIKCINFINKIQLFKKRFCNQALANKLAIDSFKTLRKYNQIVNSKCLNLSKQIKNKNINYKLKSFIKYKFLPEWKKLNKNKINFVRENKNNELILSPSDFTFQNIIKKNSKLFFFDFEYSGLDNPIKLITDFICQPNIKINKFQIGLIMKFYEKKYGYFDYKTIKYITIIAKFKWTLIYINKILNNSSFEEDKLKNIKKYFFSKILI